MGFLIDTNLFIAAAGLAHGHAVATANAKEFRSVPELDVIPI